MIIKIRIQIVIKVNEPGYSIAYKTACALSEDLHPRRLIRVFAVCLKKLRILGYPQGILGRFRWDCADGRTCTLEGNAVPRLILYQVYLRIRHKLCDCFVSQRRLNINSLFICINSIFSSLMYYVSLLVNNAIKVTWIVIFKMLQETTFFDCFTYFWQKIRKKYHIQISPKK